MERNRAWAKQSGIEHELSYGQSSCVVYAPDPQGRHGNFLPETYAAVLQDANWQKRLEKGAYQRPAVASPV